MRIKSICRICGRETPIAENICELGWIKEKLGFVSVQVTFAFNRIRTLNFCPSCAKKSYTIEELATIGNYNQWSY